jgi:hypothetical protein
MHRHPAVIALVKLAILGAVLSAVFPHLLNFL